VLKQKKLKMLNLVKDPSNFGKSYIALEDMTKEMKFPCLMDVKIGSKAYNPLKIERQNMKIRNSSSSSMGFRLCGLNIYELKENEY